MKSYRVGVVGLSGIAASPAPEGPAIFRSIHPHSHVACYANHPRTEVVAICDLMPALFDEFDRNWGDHWPNVARYSDYQEMLARERLDIISVVTPDHRHAQIVIDAVSAGVKGIFCEKPIATTLAEADRMIEATKTHGVPMIVNLTRRWYGTYHHARELIRIGHLGRVSHIHAVGGGPRSMLFRNGSHLIDAVNIFAESEPNWVAGYLDPEHERYGPHYAGAGGRDPALDPGASVLVHFENGVIASIFYSKAIERDAFLWEITVYGEKGYLRISEPGGIEVNTLAADDLGGRTLRTIEPPLYHWTDGTAAIEDLISIMESRSSVSQSPPEEARKSLAIALAILQSQHDGNRPVSAPFADA